MNPGDHSGPASCHDIVPSTTLDRLLFDVHRLTERPAAMKMDIEGFETMALRGAGQLLSGNLRPCRIWFEHIAEAAIRAGGGRKEIFDILEAAGYKIFKKNGQRVEAPDFGGPSDGDYYAILEPKPAEC